MSFAQQKFDTIYVVNYISNPSSSDFICDKGKCEGWCETYFDNGKVYWQGKFQDGQPTDSLFKYYPNGQLQELFVPMDKGWRMLKYYFDGQIESEYDVKERFEKQFYPNGKLKLESKWTKRYRSKTKEYYSTGVLKLAQKNKSLVKYGEDGIIVQRIKRKEILVLDRIFSKDAYDRYYKFYEYEWESFDKTGVLNRKIVFSNDGFLTSPFPDSVKQIDDYLFDIITFYQNGQEFKKVEFKYVQENDELIKKLFIYRKEKNQWIEEKRTTANKVYEIITSLSA